MDQADIQKRFSEFLNHQQVRMSARDNRVVSQSEMARRIGVAQGSLSQWMTGTRLPQGDNVHRLAGFFGVQIYDLLELPRSMPDDPSLKRVAEVWGRLPQDMRKKFANAVEDEAEEWNDNITLAGDVK